MPTIRDLDTFFTRLSAFVRLFNYYKRINIIMIVAKGFPDYIERVHSCERSVIAMTHVKIQLRYIVRNSNVVHHYHITVN